jgi:hypothetical protein
MLQNFPYEHAIAIKGDLLHNISYAFLFIYKCIAIA